MKIKYILLFSMLFLFVACEEVVDVNLNTAAPRLVIDAAIKWQKGTSGNLQTIRLSTTTGYFSDEIPSVSGATVSITDSQNNIFTFTEVAQTGEYACSDFVPILNESYTLNVVVNGQSYSATENLQPVPVIDNITQSANGGFTGDEPEVRVFFTDNAITDDFYLFSYLSPAEPFPLYGVQEDRLIQGNQSFDVYSNEYLNSGDQMTLSLSGISQRYYNYLRVLLSISGGGGGSPFQSPPATVRGNIVNLTNTDNYTLGFFSLSETDIRTITIE